MQDPFVLSSNFETEGKTLPMSQKQRLILLGHFL